MPISIPLPKYLSVNSELCVIGSPDQDKCIAAELLAHFKQNDPFKADARVDKAIKDNLGLFNIKMGEIVGLAKAKIENVTLKVDKPKFTFTNELSAPKLSASFFSDCQLLRGVMRIFIKEGRIKYTLYGDVVVVKGEEHFKIVRAQVEIDMDDLSFDLTGLEDSPLSRCWWIFGNFGNLHASFLLRKTI
jgi:hypothetical protein